MKTKKIILIAVAVVVVVGAGIWFFAGSPAKHKVTYATTTVSKGDISNSVTATGTIEPVTEVEVGTQVSGIIDKIYAVQGLGTAFQKPVRWHNRESFCNCRADPYRYLV